MPDEATDSQGIFSAAGRDLCRVRKYIFFSIGVFILGIAAGLAYPSRFQPLFESFREFALGFRGESAGAMIAMIFLKNASASLSSLLLGLLFGIVPLISSAVNGILIGVVLARPGGPGLPEFMAKLLPHGMFELPAVFISWGLGIWMGTWWLGRGDISAREKLKKALRIFFVIVLPLLVVAAIIEGLSIAGRL